jgi:hypothetical protein
MYLTHFIAPFHFCRSSYHKLYVKNHWSVRIEDQLYGLWWNDCWWKCRRSNIIASPSSRWFQQPYILTDWFLVPAHAQLSMCRYWEPMCCHWPTVHSTNQATDSSQAAMTVLARCGLIHEINAELFKYDICIGLVSGGFIDMNTKIFPCFQFMTSQVHSLRYVSRSWHDLLE